MFIVRHIQGNRVPTGLYRIASFVGQWESIHLPGTPARVRGVHVPDDHPDLREIRSLALQLKLTEVRDDADVVRDAPAPRVAGVAPDAPAVTAQADLVYLHRIARGRGWSNEDLVGTGLGGDPGDAGGRSPRTGLSLAELTLTRPPIGWAELAGRGRPPWEAADWAPPHPAWAPPAWAKLLISEDEHGTLRTAPLAPGEITDREGYERAKAEGGIEEIPPGDPRATAPVGGVELDPRLLAAKADAEALAKYPDENTAQMRSIVIDLYQRAGGKPPHPNAVNFMMKKFNPPLPPVNTAQIRAVISSHTTT